jgi:hypothetical protein
MLALYDLPPATQDAALRLKTEFAAILESGQPAEPRLRALAASGQRGMNLKTLQKKLKAYRETRDELTLVDRRLFTKLQKIEAPRGLHPDFLAWAGGQLLGNQRKSRPAYRDILRRWETWRRTHNPELAIPGYDTPPIDCGKGYPEGWSYRNLMARAQPPRVQLTIARQGTAAAKPHLPLIHGTREGCRWLEWIFFDDLVRDRNIIVPGHMHPVRMLQFGGLDYASACYLKFGIRPDLPRKDGVRDRLKRRDFLFLVATLLMEYGYPLDHTMHLVCERGTATMNQAEAHTLYLLSNGQIQVGYSSMDGQFVLAWEEAKSGNSTAKGALESWHNLFHNYEGSFNGQVGKDRDHSPASLYGSNREALALNKAGLLLTPDQRAGLRLPYSTFTEAHHETLDTVARINNRRDHELEGFRKILLWRLRGTEMEWRPEAEILNLSQDLRPHVEFRPVNESPRERALALSNGVRTAHIPPGALVRFFEDSHTAARVNGVDATIKLEGRTYHFGPDTPEQAVADREEIILHHAPINPEWAIVTHRNLCVGVWKRRRILRGDNEALAQESRRKQIFLNQAVGQVRGKMAEKLESEQRRMDHNIDILANAGLVPSDTLQTLASGRHIVRTQFADAMHAATETARTQAATEKARAESDARLARQIGPEAANDMLDPSPLSDLSSPVSDLSSPVSDLPSPLSEEIPW